MPNYTQDWSNYVFLNIPYHLRKVFRFTWIKLLVSQVDYLHGLFLSFRTETIYTITHTNQKVSIEKVLNDKFDPNNEQIFISLLNPVDKLFLYQKSEESPLHLFSKWDSSVSYSINDHVSYLGNVWKATDASTNETPADGSAFWELVSEQTFLHKGSEHAPKGFIVNVPNTITFDENHMKALIDKYRLAGMYYEIQTYTP